MAAYSQSITQSNLTKVIESNNDVQDKIHLDALFAILITEFAAAETAGLASYTVTTGLQASLEDSIRSSSNVLRVEFLRTWITYIVTEFTAVETGGLSYVRTTDSTRALNEFIDLLHQAISYMTCSEVKIGFHSINTYLNTEFGLMAAAS